MDSAANKQETFSVDPNEKTICILQLTRMGDILQTIQSVRNLRKQFPQMHLKIVVRESFARPINFLLNNLFDEIITLNIKDLIIPNSLPQTIENLQSFTNRINATHNDLLINLSYSKSSSFLTPLIKATHKMGINRDHAANQYIPDKWSQYIYATIMDGDLNPFPLVDIFNHLLGVPNLVTDMATINKKSNLIAIHPFSSGPKKNWPISKWTEVLYKILKNIPSAQIVILGSVAEQNEANKLLSTPLLRKYTDRIENLAGKTTIQETLTTIEKSRFLIAHDSMNAHLATFAKRTSLILSLGTVRPIETAPYIAGSYILTPKSDCFPCFPQDKCNFFQCHADIPYQLVYVITEKLFHQGEITASFLKDNSTIFHLNSVNLYKTYFNENKMLNFEALIKATPSIKTLMRQFYRLTWLFYLGNQEEKSGFLELNEHTANELGKILVNLQHLFELFNFGKKYSMYILEEISGEAPHINKIKEFSQKIDEIEHLSKLILKTTPLLAPIIHFFAIMRANLQGTNIVELTQENYLSFDEGSSVISILYELIESNLAEYQQIRRKKITSSATQV